MHNNSTILVIDDDSVLLSLFTEIFETAGYDVLAADSGDKGLNIFREQEIDVVILDLVLPNYDGLDILKEILDKNPMQLVIIISGHGTIEKAVEATRTGVYDFLEKPVEPERMLLSVKNAIEKTKLLQERQLLLKQPERRYKMVGVSTVMRNTFQLIDRIAPTNSRVIISGESGTGKDLVAQAIHLNSLRADKMFYRLNCAAIPEELVESELFGHKKGAFTDAINDKKGFFLLSDKSTLFLDEIGDLSLRAQAKVLRAIDDGEFTPVGGDSVFKVDVRIICATNQNLEEMMNEKKFRDDLFHRINGVNIFIPPLRQRREDIAPLSIHFLNHAIKQNQLSPKRFTFDALELLTDQPWKGNVRQLKNFIEQICVLSDSEIITASIVSKILNLKNIFAETMEIEDFNEARANFEKNYLLKYLIKFNWNVSLTAKNVGLERTTLHRKMKRYGINGKEKTN